MRVMISLTILFAVMATAAAADSPALTIYNQNFAVVRQLLTLELQAGANDVQFSGTTAQVEPSSVILRSLIDGWRLSVLEQSYRNDPISQPLLLALFEGQTIDFLVSSYPEAKTVRGRIVRSGYVPVAQTQRYRAAGSGQPIIEVNGQLRFGLPGLPLFPDLADDTILKPTLNWRLQSDQQGTVKAELGYITGGLSWQADYNVVAATDSDDLELLGWVTVHNNSGRSFPDARLKLMAGDVRKLAPPQNGRAQRAAFDAIMESRIETGVTERTFDEYHLYTLERPTTLRDQETKQVEFLRSPKVESERLYIYDGVFIDPQRYGHYAPINRRQDTEYGIEYNSKVWVVREFDNSEQNGLGVPLPKGRIRFYRRDVDGQLEFTGENLIDHTPRDERIRVHTGNAFDLVGQRLRTSYQVDSRGQWVDERFQIELRNRKEEDIEIRVVEHLYRWSNWEIRSTSVPYRQIDSRTIEFVVPVAAGETATVDYSVHYSW